MSSIGSLDGPGLALGRLFFGATLLVASILMTVATSIGVASGSVLINYGLACLGFLAAFLQGWGMFPLAVNARIRARALDAPDWNIIRNAWCTREGREVWVAGPGWILIEERVTRIEIPRSRFAFRSLSERISSIDHDSVESSKVMPPFKGGFPRIYLEMDDGSTIEIDLAPNSGSTGWGVGNERITEIVRKLGG